MAQLQPNESFAERLIRQAMDRGEFDDLPGKGKPIAGAGTRDDDLWWVRAWLERDRRSHRPDGRDPGAGRVTEQT